MQVEKGKKKYGETGNESFGDSNFYFPVHCNIDAKHDLLACDQNKQNFTILLA